MSTIPGPRIASWRIIQQGFELLKECEHEMVHYFWLGGGTIVGGASNGARVSFRYSGMEETLLNETLTGEIYLT